MRADRVERPVVLSRHARCGEKARMWIVRLALRRPYTFAVLALLIAILGVITIVRTPTDIFPNINIPVVSVIDEQSQRLLDIRGRADRENGAQAAIINVTDDGVGLTGVQVDRLFEHFYTTKPDGMGDADEYRMRSGGSFRRRASVHDGRQLRRAVRGRDSLVRSLAPCR